MILIWIDEKIGTYTQKKPIFQLFDPYLSLKWSWISHKQIKYFTTRSVLIFLYIWNKSVCDCSKETLNLSTFTKKKAYF